MSERAWETVYQDLREQIEDAVLAEGSACPSEKELVELYRERLGTMSRGTVRQALAMLAQDGYLELIHGKRRIIRRPGDQQRSRIELDRPDWVSDLAERAQREHWKEEDAPRHEIHQRPRLVAWYQLTELGRIDTAAVKEAFGYQSEEEAWWASRITYVHNRPVSMQWIVWHAGRVGAVSKRTLLEPGGLIRLYGDAGWCRFRIAQRLVPAAASPPESRGLRIERGTPLIAQWRLLSASRSDAEESAESQPLELSMTLFTDLVELGG